LDLKQVTEMTEFDELRIRRAASPRREARPTAASTTPRSRLWIVITDRTRPIREVIRELAHAGFEVGHVLETMGGITGSAEEQAVERIRKVRGVVNIWPDACLEVDPPTSALSG